MACPRLSLLRIKKPMPKTANKDEEPDFNDPADPINQQIEMFDKVRVLEVQVSAMRTIIYKLLEEVGWGFDLRAALADLEEDEEN